ncbi:MAG: NAD(P)/FAD-dependent oxidoreductase [Planctomycetota bacterium]
MSELHHVVIVGGGFGGLACARHLRRARVRITLLDRRNFHLFQPLLYQVATGGLSPANIAAPLRSILRRQRNCQVLLGEVQDFDLERKRVVLADDEISFDSLVVAAGASHSYFGHDEWKDFAPGLKTVEDATRIRARILQAFEAAERASDPVRIQELLTFVIIGGGPTGVELAGAIAEIAHRTLRRDFRTIDPSSARVLLVEGSDRVLASFSPKSSAHASSALERLGVTLCVGAKVTAIDADSVRIERPGREPEVVRSQCVLWAAGVKAAPVATKLAQGAGVSVDRAGRLAVQPDLTLAGHPEVFVIGDMALVQGPSPEPTPGATPAALPGLAPVAMQEGRYVARLIRARLEGRRLAPFRYRDRGKLATVGRSVAVAEIARFELRGYFAWLIWLFVHVLEIVQFESRILVAIQWAWNYFTFNRTARLITHSVPPPRTGP